MIVVVKALLIRAALLASALLAAALLASCGQPTTGSGATTSPSPSSGAVSDPALLAWVAGDGVKLATTDGGMSWRRQTAPALKTVGIPTFCDRSHGWALGADFVVATTDGGATWTRHELGIAYDANVPLCGLAAADSQHLWVVGDGVLFTSDGGATWVRQDRRECLGVTCSDTAHAWVTTGVGPLLATSDGGASWRPTYHSASRAVCITAVSCDAAGGVWAVGSVGGARLRECVLWSRDGGATWRLRTFGPDFLSDVALGASGHVWAVGSGRVYSTRDGGRHWEVQKVGTEEPASASLVLWGVAFSDSLHGWVVGSRVGSRDYPSGHERGVIYGTRDGGRTWRRLMLARRPPWFQDVTCLPL